jgi:hypothetical protein
MIKRQRAEKTVSQYLKHFPIVAILGARQVGKTTLAKSFNYNHFFDLENPRDAARLSEPQLALENLEGLIVIDEIQRKPNLFPLLRYLVDRGKKQRFLILGSASQDLIKQSSESLAGRIAYYQLGTFILEEVGKKFFQKLWLRGGFPRSFLSKNNEDSKIWRDNFISTFLERDIPQLGIRIASNTLRRFWMMISHYHGQVLNYSELGRSFGISDMTARHYIDILEGTFMLRVLQPWHGNLSKRQIKSPKIYIRDSGLFHTLQSIDSKESLFTNPKLGASWEGFALENVVGQLGLNSEEIFFWGTHSGAEIDLMWHAHGKQYGIEFKYTDAPQKTKSMESAIESLHLEHLWVINPGDVNYPIDKKITAVGLNNLNQLKT